MKRRSSGFNFRGFVALADLIFAVSAGLLLLNPIQFDAQVTEPQGPKANVKPQAQNVVVQMREVEERLDEFEKGNPVLQRRAIDVMKNE
ncbi:MAG TPA: hypothetical protein VIW67_10880 [Terriglobales bacterium]|jgi:hypothetical protein